MIIEISLWLLLGLLFVAFLFGFVSFILLVARLTEIR